MTERYYFIAGRIYSVYASGGNDCGKAQCTAVSQHQDQATFLFNGKELDCSVYVESDVLTAYGKTSDEDDNTYYRLQADRFISSDD